MGIERWLEALHGFNAAATAAVKNVEEYWGAEDWTLEETRSHMSARRARRRRVRSELEDLFLRHFGAPGGAFREGTPEFYRAREALFNSFNQNLD